MVTISNGSVRANIYETLYDTLNSANLASSTATVTAAYIDEDSAFPQVVINPTSISHDSFSMDRTNTRKTISVVIDIYTKKNKNIDLISDEIDALIRPLKIAGITLIGWDEDIALSTDNDNKIHLKTISLTYMR